MPKVTDRDLRLLRATIALSARSMAELAGEAADEIRLGCAEVLTHGTRAAEVAGPMLEDEARRVFDGLSRPLEKKGPHAGF